MVDIKNNEFAKQLKTKLKPRSFNVYKKEVKTLDTGEEVWLIESGYMMGLIINQEGRQKGIGILGVGDLLGLDGSDNDHLIHFAALEDSVIQIFSYEQFMKVVLSDLKLMKWMLMYTFKRYNDLLDEFANTMLPLHRRIDCFRKKANIISPRINMNLSETQLAYALGVHPVSICRAQKKYSKSLIRN